MNVLNLIENIEEFLEGNTKLHLATGREDKREPLYIYYRGEFKTWQESQTKNNFNREYILSLIEIAKDEWLFVGIYRKIACNQVGDRFIYDTELLDVSTDLIGRLVIKFNKSFRNSYVLLEKYINDFELSEIKKERYSIEPFPGYENVRIKYDLLKTVISQDENSWKTALSNVKGVYLISDLATGKLYVGAAYGKDAFWSRWTEYVQTKHGGNKLLKEVISKKGDEYAENFQFTILETRSMNAEDDEITDRETFWKEILLTRDFGYNNN